MRKQNIWAQILLSALDDLQYVDDPAKIHADPSPAAMLCGIELAFTGPSKDRKYYGDSACAFFFAKSHRSHLESVCRLAGVPVDSVIQSAKSRIDGLARVA